MKKHILFFIALLSFCCFSFAQKTVIDKELLKRKATEKVQKMQSVIRFDDKKAKRLTAVEYKFSLGIEKAMQPKKGDSAEKIEKMIQKRDRSVQKILSDVEYLKYNAIDNDRIKPYPVRVK